jgi:hypothetical protein
MALVSQSRLLQEEWLLLTLGALLIKKLFMLTEIAPELTGHGLPLSKCEAYNRVYDQFYQSR